VPQTGITGNFDPTTGVLTLTGPASVAAYQRALRGVRYANTSHNPITTARTVTFQVTDGAAENGSSNVVARTVQVRPVNTAPVLTVPAVAPTGPRNSDLAITGISALDVDANGGVERLTLRARRGTIGFVSLAGLTIVSGANNSALLVVEGTLAQLNDALAGDNLVFRPATDFAGTAVLGLTLNDGANSGTGTARASSKSVRIAIT
jgi:large repetitive protein